MKVTGPMFSLDASGTIGGAITASKWKGRQYFRIKTTPANPKSGAQVGNRQMMKFLSQNWANLTTNNQATWEDDAANLSVSPFNAFIKTNMELWRHFLPPVKETPYAASGTPGTLDTWTATAGVRLVQLALSLSAAADNYGAIIFRSTTTGFTPSKSNAIATVRLEDTTEIAYVDSPLEAGTYYYVHRLFTDDGVLDAASAEVSAVVT